MSARARRFVESTKVDLFEVFAFESEEEILQNAGMAMEEDEENIFVEQFHCHYSKVEREIKLFNETMDVALAKIISADYDLLSDMGKDAYGTRRVAFDVLDGMTEAARELYRAVRFL